MLILQVKALEKYNSHGKRPRCCFLSSVSGKAATLLGIAIRGGLLMVSVSETTPRLLLRCRVSTLRLRVAFSLACKLAKSETINPLRSKGAHRRLHLKSTGPTR